jgi:hypothetical protein
MRVIAFFLLFIATWAAKAPFDAVDRSATRRLTEMATTPVKPFTDHWYMGPDGIPRPRPDNALSTITPQPPAPSQDL